MELRRTSTAWIAAYVSLGGAILFYWFAVLRVDFFHTGLLDLDPQPDAVEYFAQANSLAAGHLPTIVIGHERLPSRYPPGFAALMVPWLQVLPKPAAILAPFRTNQTTGLLLLLGAFGVYARLRRPVAAAAAAWLLVTLPAFVSYTRSSLSEITASALIAAAFACVHAGLLRSSRAYIYAGAILLGFSTNVRTQCIFFAPLLLAMALLPVRRAPLQWVAHCAGAVAAFGAASSPVFFLNNLQFGSPLKTGYDFWVPSLTEHGLPFSLANVAPQANMIWHECTLTKTEFAVANMFGTGAHVVPAFVLLAILGVGWLRRSRFLFCAAFSAAVFVAATATYSFVDARFYLPIFVLSVGLAVLPIEWAARRIASPRYQFAALCVFIVGLAAVFGYPSQSGYKPEGGHSQWIDAVRLTGIRGRSARFAAQQELVRDVPAAGPAFVLSDIDPAYLSALLPNVWAAAPIDQMHNYRLGRQWRYDRDSAKTLVVGEHAKGHDVYALYPSTVDLSAAEARLPGVTGQRWALLPSVRAPTMILKLTPQSSLSSETTEAPNP